MLADLSPQLLQRAFVETQAGWYLAQDVRSESGVVWSDLITDRYWNFVTSPSDIDGGLDTKLAKLRARGRRPAVYLTDAEAVHLDASLRQRGYRLTDREAVLASTQPPLVSASELDVRAVQSAEEVEDLMAVFVASHANDADALYGELDAAYVDALRRSVGRSDTWHYVGYLDEEPVAIGSMSIWQGLCGLYNGATRPEHRRRGYGTALMQHRVATAFAHGAHAVFMQTVAGEAVERRYLRHGFHTVFVGHLYEPDG